MPTKYTKDQLAGIDKPLIKKWLETLESGELKQTRGNLVSGNGQSFCCLGVACKIEGTGVVRRLAGGSDNAFWWKDPNSIFWSDSTVESGMPPEHILDKLGMSQWGTYPLNAGTYASMNDDDRASFKEIAKQLRTDYAAAGLDLDA